jgi:hypothetical protein
VICDGQATLFWSNGMVFMRSSSKQVDEVLQSRTVCKQLMNKSAERFVVYFPGHYPVGLLVTCHVILRKGFWSWYDGYFLYRWHFCLCFCQDIKIVYLSII